MSAPYIIPFNFQPSGVSVRTSSYTIPAGKYANVVVALDGTGSFSINGTACITSTNSTVLSASPLNYGVLGGGSGNGLAVHNSTTTSAGLAFTSDTERKPVTASYWLPSGTVLNGSNFKAVVTEYNNIS